MNYIKKFNEFLNEELKHLPPPTDEDTEEEFNKLSPDDALWWSLDGDSPEYVKKAIKRGADINLKNKNFNASTALFIAMYCGFNDISDYLKEHGAKYY